LVLFSSIFGFLSDLGIRVSSYLGNLYFQVLKKCKHFEWLDEYINRIKLEGVNLPSPVEQLGSATVVAPGAAPVGEGDGVVAEVAQVTELKKMNKHLTKLVKLKEQDNVMSAIFYLCAIALGVVYLLIISHYTMYWCCS
jgi:hypothetical protein